jgi:hypothetical protein
MARRRAPRPPSREAQKRAFYKASDGQRHRILAPGPPPTYGDLRFFLEEEIAALNEEERKRKGAPGKLARAIRALEWLADHGIDKLSDAPRSRCVKCLERFLSHERAATPTAKKPAKTTSTAQTLAGTLLAYEGTIRITRSQR